MMHQCIERERVHLCAFSVFASELKGAKANEDKERANKHQNHQMTMSQKSAEQQNWHEKMVKLLIVCVGFLGPQ